MSAAQVEQAVLALHNPQNREQHEQANLFLLNFSESASAWGVSLDLLTRSPLLLVQFFAANCLYSKIVRDWLQIQDEGSITSVTTTLLHFLQGCSDVGQPSDHRTVAARVCLALAALSVKLRDGIPQLMQEVFGSFFGGSMEALATLNPGAVTLGLLIVRSLPEEVEKVDMSRHRRDELQGRLRDVAPNVLQLVDFLSSNRSDLAAEALQALGCWLSIGTITTTGLARDTPSLFDCLCGIIRSPESVPVELMMAACGVMTRLANISEYPRPSGRDAAVSKVMESLLAGLPIAMRVLAGPDDEPMHAYCSMVIEVGKSEVGMISQGIGPSLNMIEMLLLLTRHPSLHVATITMEFWEAFREIPVAKRVSCLGQPLFFKLIEALVDRLSYPSDFTSWDREVSVDQEDFSRFRESDLAKDLLESCYQGLRSQYFLQLGQRLDTARDMWQIAEVALLMMQQVAHVTLQYLDHGHVGTAGNPTTAEDQVNTARFLLQTMHKFTSSSDLYSHPLVMRSLVRLLGSYHKLLSPKGSTPNKRLLDQLITEDQSSGLHRLVLRCLLQGLTTQDAGEPASISLKAVCVSPGGLAIVKQDRECLELLMASFEKASVNQLEIAHQLTVVEAIVRVVIETDQARAGLNHFTAPILNGLSNALASNGTDVTGQQRETVKVALQLLGQTVRFLDQCGTTGLPPPTAAGGGVVLQQQHLAQDLVDSLWPLLERVSLLYRSDEEVLCYLFEVFKHLVVGLRPLVAPRLPQLLRMIADLYASTAHEGALNVVAGVVEIFTSDRVEDHQVFTELLATICQHTWEYVRAGHAPSECPGLVTSFFDMVMRYLSFRSTVLYESSELPMVLDFALECLKAMERESTRSVLRWIREVFRHIETNPQEPSLVVPIRLLEERGQCLISVTMAALAGRAPSTLWANYFELYYGMILAWGTLAGTTGSGNPCLAWIRNAAFDASVIGEALPRESREMLVVLIQKQAMEGKQKLKLFMDDVAKICKSEQDPEALASYQL